MPSRPKPSPSRAKKKTAKLAKKPLSETIRIKEIDPRGARKL